MTPLENSASLRPRPKMAHPMAIDNPYNAQFKAMFWRIKFYTDAATELVNGQGIDSIEEIKTLAQYHVTRL